MARNQEEKPGLPVPATQWEQPEVPITPAAFVTEETKASTATTDALQISPVLPHNYSCLLMPPTFSCRSRGPTLAASPGLCGCVSVQGVSLDATSVYAFGGSPSSPISVSWSPLPCAGLRLHHAGSGGHAHSQGPHRCLWAWIWPCLLPWPVPLCHLQLTPLAVYPPSPRLTPDTDLHCCAPVSRTPAASLVHTDSKAPAGARAPVAGLSPEACPGSHHYMCVCILPTTQAQAYQKKHYRKQSHLQ